MAATVSDEPRGLFITLEGGEGAGKSVQLEALAMRLEAAGQSVVRTREPGGTALGERLREALLELPAAERQALDPLTESLLFVAARSELVAEVIAPALARGDVVICDRFSDSTLAYQGFGRALDLLTLEELNSVAVRGLQPDLTVLLDISVEVGLERSGAKHGGDRFEREGQDFHERVRRGYRSLAGRDPDRWLVVDASQPRVAVTDTIWKRVQPLVEAK